MTSEVLREAVDTYANLLLQKQLGDEIARERLVAVGSAAVIAAGHLSHEQDLQTHRYLNCALEEQGANKSFTPRQIKHLLRLAYAGCPNTINNVEDAVGYYMGLSESLENISA